MTIAKNMPATRNTPVVEMEEYRDEAEEDDVEPELVAGLIGFGFV